ncbi:MAG: alanine--tRNA ligase [Eubacterium sp.]|nr:alanine--tRNA ligase [Eubacterium sp.]
MKPYGLNELRKMYLDFFESKGHLIMPSFSLVPQNDKSLLLINAGMAPLKPYFTGQEIPPRKRVATCQKCIRTGDIENVGRTARHGTFFEMLGNFSFGDYFKHEAIAWSWEFLTEVLEIPADRLYPSVYEEDDEAFEIWEKEIGIAPERIFRFGKEDNFWEHGAGPCGPCSEIYFDRGEEHGCGKPGCTVGCDCDRYIEIWNNVFTQFEGDGHGGYTELENKNIDTGMGLERLATVMQDVESIFDVDTIRHLREEVCRLAGVTYGEDYKTDVSVRVVTDHIRSVTFMVSDGVTMSNEGRGYVLRRLLRRASRHGRLLGINDAFLADLSEVVIEDSKSGYPDLETRKEYIKKVISVEEDNFDRTINQGLQMLDQYMKIMKETGAKQVPGDVAFRLNDTYGFPLDLIFEIVQEHGFTVDERGFDRAMENQRQTARAARKETNYMGADETVYQQIDASIGSEFIGYDRLRAKSEITVMTSTDAIVDKLKAGEMGTIIVEETPFYATMGGQLHDTGSIETPSGLFRVDNVIHLPGTKIGHVGEVIDGSISVGEMANLSVNRRRRQLTANNHTATHIMQEALRRVLGTHVEQKGSYVDAERLRFDFTHFSPMTDEEIRQVEEIVNDQIARGLHVITKIMTMDEAKKTGAMALFGEKYGEKVRVVFVEGFSTELCGGTHVSNSREIVAFKIISESGVASGVRRIEALTSTGLIEYLNRSDDMLANVARKLKGTPSEVEEKVEHLQEEIKALQKENEKLKAKLAKDAAGDVTSEAVDIDGIKVVVKQVDGVDNNGLRNLSDDMKQKLGDSIIVLASSNEDGKVSLIATATDGAIEKGANAGALIKDVAGLVGGGGGGKPQMAQAGGKNPGGIPEALKRALVFVKESLTI